MASLRSFCIIPLVFLAAVGCAAAGDAPTDADEGAVEVQAQDLWAGLVSYAIERSASDPCNNGANKLDTEPLGYDSWARQRAGIRNICFEVWKPGVTDRDNPDFWRVLDVKVHYRFKGTTAWKVEPVNLFD